MSSKYTIQQHEIDRKQLIKSRKILQRVYHKNVDDTADAVIQVMIICCIPKYKAVSAKPIIVKSFTNFQMVCYRVDRLPKKRFCKKNFVHSLTNQSNLTLKEIMITYSITLRAFKAFYFATTECGICSKEFESYYNHNRECFWVHAAKRTAQIFAEYEGVFHAERKFCEERIKCVYKHLNDLINSRCGQCTKRSSKKPSSGSNKRASSVFFDSNLLPKKSQIFHYDMSSKDSSKDSSKSSSKESSKESSEVDKLKIQVKTCDCPKLEYSIPKSEALGMLSWEGSQGPFTCHWSPANNEEPFQEICDTATTENLEPCVEPPMNSTESEIECNYEDGFECQGETFYEDVYENMMESDFMSNENTIQDDSEFTCHVPACERKIELLEEVEMQFHFGNGGVNNTQHEEQQFQQIYDGDPVKDTD